MKAAIVLAGGLEGKFWPRSGRKSPKPYSYITGDRTLLEDTIHRLKRLLFKAEEIYIVTIQSLYEQTKQLLPEIPAENILAEPYQKGTASCIALVVHHLREKLGDDGVITTFPADHIIYNIEDFSKTLETAINSAKDYKGIITIGLQPDRPETGYGYIQINEAEHVNNNKHLMKCLAFAEKPDIGTAERFIQSGDFLWNSGIYTMIISTFLEKMDKHLPSYNPAFSEVEKFYQTDKYQDELTKLYKKLAPTSFDTGVLEKADRVAVIKGEFDWTDLNDWDEYYRITPKDGDGNLIQGNVISIDNKNTMVISDDDQIGVIGLEDIVVINHDNGLLVCKKDETQRVEEIINYMKINKIGGF